MSRWKVFLTVLLLCLAIVLIAATSLLFAQNSTGVKRVESYDYDATTQVLRFTTSSGAIDDNGDYTPKVFDAGWEIRFEDDENGAPTMWHSGEGRKFSPEEAARMIRVMTFIARYCAGSHQWWEAGQGEPLKPKQQAIAMR